MKWKVHVKKDISDDSSRYTKWYVYCDGCDMNDQTITTYIHEHVSAKFRSYEMAIAVAFKHAESHLKKRITFGRFWD